VILIHNPAANERALARLCGVVRRAGLSPLPATGEAVALYIAALADQRRKASGIELALIAISQAKAKGFESPRRHAAVERVRKGIRRTLGTAQKGRAPLLLVDLWRLCAALPADAQGDRDWALLLIGWAAMMRRSELAGLDLADIREVPGERFIQAVMPILAEVGPFPHAPLDWAGRRSGPKKQVARLLKVECQECGLVVRQTRKWIEDVGPAHWPEHGEMQVADVG
jgi:hypothetical protein